MLGLVPAMITVTNTIIIPVISNITGKGGDLSHSGKTGKYVSTLLVGSFILGSKENLAGHSLF